MGRDTLAGGMGDDTFVFDTAERLGSDRISDFGNGDAIEIDILGAGTPRVDMADWPREHLQVVNGDDVLVTLETGSTILVQDATLHLVEHSIFPPLRRHPHGRTV